MTPAQLATALKDLVARETGCTASWEQHPGPLERSEVRRIMLNVSKLFSRAWKETEIQHVEAK